VSEQKQALSSSGVVVGDNVSERIQRVMRKMVEQDDARLLEERKAAERADYDERPEVWCFVKTMTAPSGKLWYSAETTSPIPGIGAHVKTDRYESSARLALAELRFKIAKLWAKKPLAVFEECRQRAAKLVFRQAIISASDTAGQE
jgi:hypothetical protein